MPKNKTEKILAMHPEPEVQPEVKAEKTQAELQLDLAKALQDSGTAEKAYDDAYATAMEKLTPLKAVVTEKKELVAALLERLGYSPATAGGGRKTNVSEAMLLKAAGKRAIAKALKANPSMSADEQKKVGDAAERALAAKRAAKEAPRTATASV
jgi:hypothetical protein